MQQSVAHNLGPQMGDPPPAHHHGLSQHFQGGLHENCDAHTEACASPNPAMNICLFLQEHHMEWDISSLLVSHFLHISETAYVAMFCFFAICRKYNLQTFIGLQ